MLEVLVSKVPDQLLLDTVDKVELPLELMPKLPHQPMQEALVVTEHRDQLLATVLPEIRGQTLELLELEMVMAVQVTVLLSTERLDQLEQARQAKLVLRQTLEVVDRLESVDPVALELDLVDMVDLDLVDLKDLDLVDLEELPLVPMQKLKLPPLLDQEPLEVYLVNTTYSLFSRFIRFELQSMLVLIFMLNTRFTDIFSFTNIHRRIKW